MDPKQTNFVVRDRVPYTAHVVVACACLIGAIGCACSWYRNSDQWNSTKIVCYSMAIIALLLAGSCLSLITTIHFDLITKKHKKVWMVLGLRISSGWKTLPNIEYVSVFFQVFKDTGDDDIETYSYTVNLWHSTNRHFTVYSNPSSEPCFNLACS